MKSIFQSKTFWVNLITFLLVILGQDVLVSIGLTAKLQMVIITTLNVILRFITNQPVTLVGGENGDKNE